MKKVDYEHFARFKTPNTISEHGGALYFLIKTADVEHNRYRSDLWRLEDGSVRRMTGSGDVGEYHFLPDGIVFSSLRDDEDKKSAKDTLPFTVLQKLPYDGGEAEEFLRLDTAAESFTFLPDGRFFFIEEYSGEIAAALKASDGDRDKAAKALKDDEDYHVVDELPFHFNGQGYINKKRSRLCLYDGGKVTELTGELGSASIAALSPDGGKLIYIYSEYDGVMPLTDSLMELDVATLEKRDISIGEKISHWSANYMPDNRLAVWACVSEKHGLNENPKIFVQEGTGWRRIYDEGMLAGENTVLSDLEPGRALPRTPMFEGGFCYRIDTVTDCGQIISIDMSTGRVEHLTHTQFDIADAVLWNDGFAAIASAGCGGYEIYRIGKNGGMVKLTSFNAAIMEEYEHSEPRQISFINEEGTEIFGWALAPADMEKGKKYPTILDIHGGPKCAYGRVYFHEMQFWASQGYAVIFCNPTGGDGRGDDFSDIRGRYGDIDFRDIMTFVDKAIESFDFIDPARIGVTGGSYGGFMTNWVIGHTDRFKAAASQRSISNWTSFYGTSDIGYYFGPDQTDSDLWSSMDKAWAQSPIHYADKCVTPTLFIHSDEDYRCPLEQGMQMFSAIRAHGVTARMCIFKGENHELSRSGKPKHRVRRLKEITEWFDKYLKN